MKLISNGAENDRPKLCKIRKNIFTLGTLFTILDIFFIGK